MKIIIIGSGMAGLTAGAYLAQAGHNVTIYEQYPTPGGVTATLYQDGFGWDLGPLILEGFGPGDAGTQVLEELGVEQRVSFLHEDRGLVLHDLIMWKPEQYIGPYWRRDRLSRLFPDEQENLRRYYSFYDRLIHLMGLTRQLEQTQGLAALWLKIRLWLSFQSVKEKATWNAKQLMDAYFHHDILKMLFTGIVADFVTKPSEFPALGVPSIHLETAFDKRITIEPGLRSAKNGFFYVIGGCQSMVDAVLFAFESHGGKVVTNTTVQQIVVDDGKAIGVRLAGGKFEAADLVVASERAPRGIGR